MKRTLTLALRASLARRGRLGGAKRSEAKAEASRTNGRLGGRPRGQKPQPEGGTK